MSSSGSGTVINYGSGSDFLTSFGSGSGSTSQKVTVPTVPVPQHWPNVKPNYGILLSRKFLVSVQNIENYDIYDAEDKEETM